MSEKSSFERLAAINVNDKIEKKNKLSYLSWAWAVDQLLRADPAANWIYGEPTLCGGETMMVHCTVTAFGKAMSSHLPVMDYKNSPIQNPNAFEMNTAMQRCLVKAIALHGLGLYIYAGEDLPEGEEHGASRPGDAANFTAAPAQIEWEQQPIDVQNMLLDVAHRVSALIKRADLRGAYDELEAQNYEPGLKAAVWSRFDSKERAALKKEGETRKEKKAA